MAKLNNFIKNKILKSREKRIDKIERNLERGKTKFILISGIVLWTPLWLMFWFFFIDLKIFNLFIDKPLNSLESIFAAPFTYFLLRIPLAAFLGYTNAVSHWHFLHRRLRILKNKINKSDDKEDFYFSG